MIAGSPSSTTMLNDQFSEAQSRDNLVFREKKNEEKLNNRGEDMESKKKDVSLPKNKIDYEETDRERVFAGDEAVMRTVTEAGDDGVRYSSAEEVGRGSGAKESVLRSLVQRAQENGTWRDSIRATKMKMMVDSLKAYNKQKRIYDNPKKSESQKEAAQMRMDQIMQNTVMALDGIR